MEIRDVSNTKNNHVTGYTKQMLLGTLLGDGCMQWLNGGRPSPGRFYITHGSRQEAYCRHKADVLKDYVRTLPAIRKNGGWGELSCVFSTVTSPAFEFLRSLCYKPNLKTGRMMKWVTPEWADQLDPVALAYWYMDDGSISTSQAWITLNTQSFTKECVRLLVKKMRTFGLNPTARPYRRRGAKQKYWVICLGAVDARKFVEIVRPHMHESMAYKLVVPNNDSTEMVICQFCGAATPKASRQSGHMVSCEKPECKATKHRIICAREDRARVNERARTSYQKNIEHRREYNRNMQRTLLADPERRARVNEARRARRAAAAAYRVPVMIKCDFCGTEIPKGNRRVGTMVACGSQACKITKHRIICRASEERLSKSRSSQSSMLETSVSGT